MENENSSKSIIYHGTAPIIKDVVYKQLDAVSATIGGNKTNISECTQKQLDVIFDQSTKLFTRYLIVTVVMHDDNDPQAELTIGPTPLASAFMVYAKKNGCKLQAIEHKIYLNDVKDNVNPFTIYDFPYVFFPDRSIWSKFYEMYFYLKSIKADWGLTMVYDIAGVLLYGSNSCSYYLNNIVLMVSGIVKNIVTTITDSNRKTAAIVGIFSEMVRWVYIRAFCIAHSDNWNNRQDTSEISDALEKFIQVLIPPITDIATASDIPSTTVEPVAWDTIQRYEELVRRTIGIDIGNYAYLTTQIRNLLRTTFPNTCDWNRTDGKTGSDDDIHVTVEFNRSEFLERFMVPPRDVTNIRVICTTPDSVEHEFKTIEIRTTN